ncbi:hypothetical protein OSB04_004120 [Centaurea solstitialis]|uniref:Uncharacterized protein n=1 Tax=Centaurea solstitialis TaxID=347529 RepID=A0AA38TWG0_9ASTR|nr:hypothetical protein OSB04_004120 [Centaurea solstitialis]
MEEMYGLMNYHGKFHRRRTRRLAIAGGFYSDQDPIFKLVVAIKYNNGLAAEELDEDLSSENRAKIMSHPLYPKLLQAYIACQKLVCIIDCYHQVGAPADISNLFDEIFRDNDFSRRSSACSCLGDDPELDEFMETYCEMLEKYRSDLARPFDEATTFLNNMQTQLTNLCKGTLP